MAKKAKDCTNEELAKWLDEFIDDFKDQFEEESEYEYMQEIITRLESQT